MSEDPAERGRKLFEEEEKQDQETAKQFDPKSLVTKSNEIRKVYHPELGEIKYTVLTARDLFEINKVEDKDARARTIVSRMLKKANPDLKEEEINEWPQDDFTKVLETLMADKSFFQPKSSPSDGSKSTSTPST